VIRSIINKAKSLFSTTAEAEPVAPEAEVPTDNALPPGVAGNRELLGKLSEAMRAQAQVELVRQEIRAEVLRQARHLGYSKLPKSIRKQIGGDR
jgi:hypothetical protein